MYNEDLSEINIIYDINNKSNFIENEDAINIFGQKFVENNKNVCKMIIENKEYNITKKFYFKNFSNNILNIKLKGIDNITNMSYMFSDCNMLFEIEGLSSINTIKVNNMECMFRNAYDYKH